MKTLISKISAVILVALIYHATLQAQEFNPDPNTANWSTYFSDFQKDTCTGSTSIITIERPENVAGVTGRSWQIKSPVNGRRAELSFTKDFIHKRRQDHYYSWRWRLDANKNITKDIAVFQWKTRNTGSFGTDGSQNYPINMEYQNGSLKLYYFAPCKSRTGSFQNWGKCKKNGGNQAFPSDRRFLLKSIPVAENQWVELVLRIKRGEAESGTSAGRVQLWVNGSLQSLKVPGSSRSTNSLTLKTDDAPDNAYDNRSVYPKWGIYNTASCAYDITTWTHALRVYNTSKEALDNLSNTKPTDASSESSSITGTWYKLKNRQTNRYMDGNGENLGTSLSSSGNDKQFRFVKQGRYYNIDIRKTGGRGTGILRTVASQNRLKITNLSPRNNNDKLYEVKKLSDGNYSIKATNNNKYFQNNTANTVTLTVKSPARNNRAKWRLIRVGASKNSTSANELLTLNSEQISNENTIKSVQLFPNPVTSNVKIKLTGIDKADITITDLLGKIVYKTTTQNNILELSKGSDFSSGMYILTVKDEFNTIYNSKMVVK